MTKYVYYFGQKNSEGAAEMKELLGGKGANLAQMAKIGMPVPPGFTISTEVCAYFYQNNQQYPQELGSQVEEALSRVEAEKNQKFGDIQNPLLFSVRSGARVSMPGMMDTVLNLGMNDKITQELAKKNPRFAWNSYWRFIFMFADVVMEADKEELSEVLDGLKKERGFKKDTDLSAEDWKETAERLKAKVKHSTGQDIPQDPQDQLKKAIGAVFKSWMNPRAITYRKLNKLPDDWGTAVNVQSMAFGNLNENSASGVGFTRNPSTGDKKFCGEFLLNAQGEDVVAGIRTPEPIERMQDMFPNIYDEIMKISETLEKYFKDMQDIEFTIESAKLWMLQTRTGKRTIQSAVKIALDMVEEGLIKKEEALLRIDANQIESFFRPSFDPKSSKEFLAKGLAASPGAVVGEVVFDPAEAVDLVEKGHKVILVRKETSPDDIHGIAVSEGVLTARGGYTSHAALVTRGMGKPAIVGCESLIVDYKNEEVWAGDKAIKKGERISIDGTSGEVFLGEVKTQPPHVSDDLGKILKWADEFRKLKVLSNTDTPQQARQSKEFGAQGIGLCRTEHMFFGEERIPYFQEMILSKDKTERERALGKILPFQKSDFTEILRVMEGLPVIIRLLDPPLHEFLPHKEEDIKKLALQMSITFEDLKTRVDNLKEQNPMLGHRGVRLAITYPEIYEMQAKAIMEAACGLVKNGVKVYPKIMIPIVIDLEEFRIVKNKIQKICQEVMENYKTDFDYKIGTMIELPRSAMLAGEIAKEAQFFSFGTNDLTQTTLGISRDDAGRFLPEYIDQKIFKEDPFVVLDQNGVGELIKIAKERGKAMRSDADFGICGEHGGDPKSIEFCNDIDLDYVSCSPFRVPVARMAAAQAAIRSR
ncbi:MAG: pyruvate, phosphate dikinase [Candidatus Pacebacteria bacterium]|nr:pyruvate, phosphate dikinase [Candidatus Paceibacterota bacterium]